jgi:hypothetical protein
MDIMELFEEWEKDGEFNKADLSKESLNIPKLHNKWYKVYMTERLKFKRLESELKTLKAEKWEFYLDGPTEEHDALGWELPPKGKILRGDIQHYLDKDKDIVELTLKIAYQYEIVDFCDAVLKMINNRGFQIKSAIDFLKFTNGIDY